jgi:hypothetical protein
MNSFYPTWFFFENVTMSQAAQNGSKKRRNLLRRYKQSYL